MNNFELMFCFFRPIILDVPHFASVKNHEREIVILRSDNGETWKEHVYDYSGSNIMEMLKSTFDKEGQLFTKQYINQCS